MYSLEKAMAPHSSPLAWKIPWTEEPCKPAVHGVAKCGTWLNNFTFIFHFYALEKEMATFSSILAWRIPGTGEPSGLPFVGSHRVGHDWRDLAAAAAQLDSKTQIFWLQNHYPPPSQRLTSMCYVYLNSYCDPGGTAATAHYSHLTGGGTGSKRWRQPVTRDLLALHPLLLPPHLVPAV